MFVFIGCRSGSKKGKSSKLLMKTYWIQFFTHICQRSVVDNDLLSRYRSRLCVFSRLECVGFVWWMLFWRVTSKFVIGKIFTNGRRMKWENFSARRSSINYSLVINETIKIRLTRTIYLKWLHDNFCADRAPTRLKVAVFCHIGFSTWEGGDAVGSSVGRCKCVSIDCGREEFNDWLSNKLS